MRFQNVLVTPPALFLLGVVGCADPLLTAAGAATPRPAVQDGSRAATSIDTPRINPLPGGVDPVVAAMPGYLEVSIEAVAGYIADRIDDRRRRIKALHDWVATRIEYAYSEVGDVPSPTSHTVPLLTLRSPCDGSRSRCSAPAGGTPSSFRGVPTRADDVTELARQAFVKRHAVCAGYAALLHELGAAAGEDIPYLTGDTAYGHHAWNAAWTGRGYELVDVTWDAGSYDAPSPRRYSTQWLFLAPIEFDVSHVPDDPRWALGVPTRAWNLFHWHLAGASRE